MTRRKHLSLFMVALGSVWAMNLPVSLAATKAIPGVPSAGRAIANTVIALVIVILLIVMLVRFLAKRANVQQRGAIQVVAARQLAPNRSVQVVEIGGKHLLLGVGEDVQLLADVTEDYKTRSDQPETKSFGSTLADVLSDLRNQAGANRDDG